MIARSAWVEEVGMLKSKMDARSFKASSIHSPLPDAPVCAELSPPPPRRPPRPCFPARPASVALLPFALSSHTVHYYCPLSPGSMTRCQLLRLSLPPSPACLALNSLYSTNALYVTNTTNSSRAVGDMPISSFPLQVHLRDLHVPYTPCLHFSNYQ
jgi:hypothetical protein